MLKIIPISGTQNINMVARLAREIWTEHYIPIIGKGQVDYMLDKFQSASAITAQLEEGVSYCLMELNGDSVGYLSYRIEENHLFLSKIYVLASQRGKGIGKEAMRFLHEKAMAAGLQKIKLTVNKYNSKSISAYEKMGFLKVNSVVKDIGKGFVMDDYVLEKNFDVKD